MSTQLTGIARTIAAFRAQSGKNNVIPLRPIEQREPAPMCATESSEPATNILGFRFDNIQASACLSTSEIRQLIASKDVTEIWKAKGAIEALGEKHPDLWKLINEFIDALTPSNRSSAA